MNKQENFIVLTDQQFIYNENVQYKPKQVIEKRPLKVEMKKPKVMTPWNKPSWYKPKIMNNRKQWFSEKFMVFKIFCEYDGGVL